MKSKAFVLIPFLFAIVFLVSSAVVVETSKDDQEDEKSQNQVGSAKQYGCRHGCCRYAGHRCVYCCSAPDSEGDRLTQNQDKSQIEEKNQNQKGSTKQYGCRHGCCRYAGHRCVYCCPAPNSEGDRLTQNQDKSQLAEESNPVNDEKHGGWGGGHGGGGWGGGGHGHGGGGWGGGGHGGGGWGGGGRGGRGGRCYGKEKESNEAKP